MAPAPARHAPARPAPARTGPALAKRTSGAAAPAPSRPGAPKRTPAPGRPRAPAERPRTALVTARGAAVLDTLLAGRGWIALVFVLLAGIVFLNVDLLRMNRDIARTVERATAVKRENSRLRAEAARLGSSERIQAVASEAGLVMPAPGAVRYLRSRPVDGRRAARSLAAGETADPATPPAE